MADYTLAICDDEPRQADWLAELVADWARQRALLLTVERFPSAEAFLFCHEQEKAVDILLLDIEMSGMSGVELARRVRAQDKRVQIVFVTGYADYLADGYEVEALHYLLKPVQPQKLAAVLDRAVQRLADRRRTLLVSAGEETVRLPLHEIGWVEVFGNYVTIHTAQKSYTVKKTLQQVELSLDDSFFRTGRSHLVNLRFVQSISRSQVVLRGGVTLPLARGRYDPIHRALIEYF